MDSEFGTSTSTTKTINISLVNIAKKYAKQSKNADKAKNKDNAEKFNQPKKKRVITGNERIWNAETIDNIDEMEQLLVVMGSFNNTVETKTPVSFKETKESPKCSENNKTQRLIQNQISQKISSYRSQDVEKGIFDSAKFIHLEVVLQRIIDSQMKCFYCREPMKLLYEYVREPKQWTVERVDNSRGHNCDNIEIACLMCNLRRRVMRQDRYIFTKQVRIVKEQEQTSIKTTV